MSETLELSIDINARRETVYGFLTDPALFKAWMGVASELADGSGASGARAFVVRYPSGDEATGELREAVPPSRVVYSWGYPDGRYGLGPGASTVVIELTAIASGTRLTLRHEGLPSTDVRDAHGMGWSHYTNQLALRAAEHETTLALGPVLDAWLAAWNTADAAAIARACEDEIEYVDRMTRLAGRDALTNYITQVRAYAPAARLAMDGAPAVTHAFARFNWHITAGDARIAAGTAFADLSPARKLVRVVSFWN